MDFGWIAPICKVSYAQKFLLNTILMPLGLQALVYATWWFSKRDEKKDAEDDAEEANDVADLSEHAEELEQEKKASRFGDHYFAFFLTCTRHTLRLARPVVDMPGVVRPHDDPDILCALPLPRPAREVSARL